MIKGVITPIPPNSDIQGRILKKGKHQKYLDFQKWTFINVQKWKTSEVLELSILKSYAANLKKYPTISL
jgi:hypothetical protein